MSEIDYYIEKGFDRRTAAYFAAGRRTIVSAAPGADFTIIIRFDNGETRILDMKDSIRPGTVFAFLADPSNFARLYLDSQGSICWDIDPSVDSEKVWSNKVDLSPDTCYLDSVPI